MKKHSPDTQTPPPARNTIILHRLQDKALIREDPQIIVTLDDVFGPSSGAWLFETSLMNCSSAVK